MLTIPLSTLGWIIIKAREFDVKDVDTGERGDEDDPYAVLEDRPNDPVFQELTGWINDMNETEQAELVALFWLGRDEGDASEFPGLVEEARGLQTPRHDTARYLLGSPLLADFIEDGLARLGYDTSDIENEVS